MLKFKNFRQLVTSVSDDYQTAYKKALSVSEGAIGGWNKMNDDTVTEAINGGVDALNPQIDTMEAKLNELKGKLNALKAALATAGSSYCTGEVSCNTPQTLQAISAAHISAINTEIEVIENNIIILRQMKAMLGFMKPDNMYFKEE